MSESENCDIEGPWVHPLRVQDSLCLELSSFIYISTGTVLRLDILRELVK